MSNYSFLILYPLGLIYLILINLGITSLFIGGYFTFVTPMLFFPLIYSLCLGFQGGTQVSKGYDFLCLLFVFYYFFITGINFLGEVGYSGNYNTHFANILYFIVVFIIFKKLDFQSEKLKKYNLLMLSIFLLSFFIFLIEGRPIFMRDSESSVSYQYVGEIFLISALIYLSMETENSKRFLFTFFSIIMLYFNGARSEFFVFVLVVITLESMHSKYFLSAAIKIGLLTLLVFIGFNLAGDYIAIDTSRILDLINNSTNASSAVARKVLLSDGVQVIMENPLIGSFSSYKPGNYIHNILSVWLDLGLMGFILYVSLIIIPLYLVVSIIFRRENGDSISLALVSILLTTLILLIFAKAFYYLAVPALWGVTSNYLSKGMKI